jgi:hypothetical protein
MVVMTHLHRDHVGWNLMSQGTTYVPTFPKARYWMSALDWDACHQPDGMGADDAGPRLAGNPVTQASDPASLINSILYGPDVPSPAPGGHQWRPMEAYGEKLSDEEVAALGSAGDGHVAEAFLDQWTRKEALAKATGRGAAAYLSRAVPVGPHMTCGRSWTVTQIQGLAGYRAAIAVEGGPVAMEMFSDPFGVVVPRLVGAR